MIQSLIELTHPLWKHLDKKVQLKFYAECILDTNYPDGTFYFVNKRRRSMPPSRHLYQAGHTIGTVHLAGRR